MDWPALFLQQKNLDAYIETNNDVNKNDIFEKKYLALLVELGELANETRCFKFWSKKERSREATIKEEYVDGIHFIMSLGLDNGFSFDETIIDPTTNSETEQFNTVFALSVSFYNEPNQKNYERLFYSYLQLGQLLGISLKDMEQAYYKKNEINFERQDQGY